MLPKIILFISILVGLISYCVGQSDTTNSTNYNVINKSPIGVGPVIGYRGFNNSLFELGFTIAGSGHGIVGHEFSFLNNLKQNNDNLSGFSLGYYRGFAFFETGINGTVYTNFDQSSLHIRPFLGLGLGGILTLCYGYNFSLSKNHFKDLISNHEFRLIARFPIGTYIFDL